MTKRRTFEIYELYECKALIRHRDILSDLENKQNGKLKI